MLVNTDVFKENETVDSLASCVGMIIDTKDHGRIKLVDFKENPEWGGQINFYLDEYRRDTCIGSIMRLGLLTGGSFLVEYVDENHGDQ